MAGFRRIDQKLFFKYRRKPDRILNLLELDFDHHTGNVRPTREYARLWGTSRSVVDRLKAEYRAAHADWDRLIRAKKRAETVRRPRSFDVPKKGHRSTVSKGLSSASGSSQVPASDHSKAGTIESIESGWGGASAQPPPNRHDWEPPGELTPRARQLNNDFKRDRERKRISEGLEF